MFFLIYISAISGQFSDGLGFIVGFTTLQHSQLFRISRPGSSWTKWLQLEESQMSSHITHWPRWAEPSAVILTLCPLDCSMLCVVG